MSLCVPGFIVGLIGASKAKRIGASPVLSRIGWIANLALVVLGLLVFILIFWFSITHPDQVRQYIHESQQQPPNQHF